MKIAFLLVCLVCAASMSALVFVISTGVIPFRAQSKAVGPKLGVVTNAPPGERDMARIRMRVDMAENVLKELDRERAELSRRASELDVQADRIRLEKAAVEAMKRELLDLRQLLNSNIVEMASAEGENVKRIAEMCAKMDAGAAAQMLLELPGERVATILGMLSDRAAAKIMDAAVTGGTQGAKKAAEWAETLRRLRKEKDRKKESQP
jgi:flagellar motility protein MotE (MotC chaperone)